MTRLPSYYRDLYLESHNDAVRLSALPADFGHYLDRAVALDQVLEFDSTVLHYMNPKPLAERIGQVSVSILPAALDELLRRSGDGRSSFFLDPFAVLVVGALPPGAEVPLGELERLLQQALADHFEAVDELYHHGASAAECESAARQVVADCDPQLQRFEVSFRFDVADSPRGERMLHYLYDVRPPSFTPAPWPARVVL